MWGLLWGLLLLQLREQLGNIELLKLLHGVALVFWCGMHITHSRGDAGMAHVAAECFGVDARGDHEAGVCVAAFVQTDWP